MGIDNGFLEPFKLFPVLAPLYKSITSSDKSKKFALDFPPLPLTLGSSIPKGKVDADDLSRKKLLVPFT